MSIISFSILALASLSSVKAFTNPFGGPSSGNQGSSSCPSVWTQISYELTPIFLGSDGQCTDLARAAIRFSFHDAGVL